METSTKRSRLNLFLNLKRLSLIESISHSIGSSVYKVTDGSSIFLLKQFYQANESQLSALYLHHLGVQFAPRVFFYNEDFQLLEYITGVPLSKSNESAHSSTDRAIATLIKDIHEHMGETAIQPPTLEDSVHATLHLAEDLLTQRELTAFKKIICDLSCRSQEQFVLHGDLHHGNIIKTIDGQYKLIDPKPLVGDLAYETSNLFYNGLDQELSTLQHTLKSRAHTLCEILNLDQRRVFQYALLHGYKRLVWFKQDGLKDKTTASVIEILHELQQ